MRIWLSGDATGAVGDYYRLLSHRTAAMIDNTILLFPRSKRPQIDGGFPRGHKEILLYSVNRLAKTHELFRINDKSVYVDILSWRLNKASPLSTQPKST